MKKFTDFYKKLSGKTKKLLVGGGVGIIAMAVIIAMALSNKSYEVMFTGVSSEEAKQIIGKLQEDGIDYQYKDGDILVTDTEMDKTKAMLVSEGYPKSGFTYDVFTSNVGLMTTDSDRRTFKMYDLETRIGSTIKLFEGVQEAYVTIALGETSKYALSDDQALEASAQAVVVMKDGTSPTEEQAQSIQLLISRSIPGMVIDNVSVFDGNGREVTTYTGDKESDTGKVAEEIAQKIEDQISAKIINVLAPVYGNGNIRVSVKGRINMDKLIRESITYNTPEKIDEQDKNGLTSEESIFREYSGDGRTASGVAGAEANADIPQYNTGGAEGDNAYGSNSLQRKFLLNQIKEQGQINPGALEDLTVSVLINGDNFGNMSEDEIRNLAGNAAGIEPTIRQDKITVVSAPFYTIEVPDPPAEPVDSESVIEKIAKNPLIVAAVAGVLLLLVLIVLLVLKRIKKKKLLKAIKNGQALPPPTKKEQKEHKEETSNEEMLTLENERGMELRKNIRDFSEQNPEIAAQLLKTWLNGGGESNG